MLQQIIVHLWKELWINGMYISISFLFYVSNEILLINYNYIESASTSHANSPVTSISDYDYTQPAGFSTNNNNNNIDSTPNVEILPISTKDSLTIDNGK